MFSNLVVQQRRRSMESNAHISVEGQCLSFHMFIFKRFIIILAYVRVFIAFSVDYFLRHSFRCTFCFSEHFKVFSYVF